MATYFAYEYTRDVPAAREFYGRLLGLDCIWDEPDDVAFVHGDVQLSFSHHPDAPVHADWAFQPGWCHGQLDDAPEVARIPSISIALEPGQFQAAVARLREAGTPALRPEPFWVGYWSFVVRGPDGRTVEVSDPVTPAS